MHDLDKVNSSRLFALWKNLSLGLAVVVCAMLISQMLSYLFSPIVALICAAVLYTMLYNSRLSDGSQCMIIIYGLFYCMVTYSFAAIIFNVLYIWDIINLPKELIFFVAPYIPSLFLDPICALVLAVIYCRLNSLRICVDCKFRNGMSIERGKFGEILHHETRIQLVNLIVIFTFLSIIVWAYYFMLYDKNADLNKRDSYIFSTLNIICILLDEAYFAIRYYNLYLDLKENGDIITEEELGDMTTKTYLRFYVICDNSIYVNTKIVDPTMAYRQIIDTPFVTKRNVNGITTSEVYDVIGKMLKIPGKLKFFYGRKNPDMEKHSLLRYFYFLPGVPEDYPELKVDGEWMDFKRIKHIYSQSPTLMSKTMLSDLSRMTTIVLTQKIFDERGYRKVKIKSYTPNYDLREIKDNDFDFQDDKWIRVAMFNSDSRGFHFRRLFGRAGSRKNDQTWRQKG